MINKNERFTVTKIDENTYALRELNHDEETNSYLLLGDKEALLIDLGMGVKNIFDVVKTITNLPIKVVITHAHWDHIGDLDKANEVFIHENELEWLKQFPITTSQVRNELNKTSFLFPSDFDINSYFVPVKEDAKTIKDNEIIDIGNREIVCLFTPGHSPGHMCFYDKKNKYLFSGDLIYKGELDCYYDSTVPELYKESVNKLKRIDVVAIFGGHHEINLPRSILDETIDAFNKLAKKNELHHQNKIFYFKNISIRL